MLQKTLLVLAAALAAVVHGHPAGLECATVKMDRFKLGAVVRWNKFMHMRHLFLRMLSAA